MSDSIKHPSHYTAGGVECIDGIKAALGEDYYIGYLWGNVMKYMWRWKNKNGVEDLKKAATYLEWMIKETENAKLERIR